MTLPRTTKNPMLKFSSEQITPVRTLPPAKKEEAGRPRSVRMIGRTLYARIECARNNEGLNKTTPREYIAHRNADCEHAQEDRWGFLSWQWRPLRRKEERLVFIAKVSHPASYDNMDASHNDANRGNALCYKMKFPEQSI